MVSLAFTLPGYPLRSRSDTESTLSPCLCTSSHSPCGQFVRHPTHARQPVKRLDQLTLSWSRISPVCLIRPELFRTCCPDRCPTLSLGDFQAPLHQGFALSVLSCSNSISSSMQCTHKLLPACLFVLSSSAPYV